MRISPWFLVLVFAVLLAPVPVQHLWPGGASAGAMLLILSARDTPSRAPARRQRAR